MTQNLHVCTTPVGRRAVVDNVGMDVSIKFGDSTSNRFRDIRGAANLVVLNPVKPEFLLADALRSFASAYF